MIEIFVAIAIVTFVMAVHHYVPGSCSGDCEQGRKPCNCDKGKWEK